MPRAEHIPPAEGSSAFTNLLEEKCRAAADSLGRQMEQQLYGFSTTKSSNWASQPVSGESSKLSLDYIKKITDSHYSQSIKDNLYAAQPLIVSPHTYDAIRKSQGQEPRYATKKEKTMHEDSTSLVAEARAERNKERAKALLPEIESNLLSHDLGAGTTVQAAVTFADSDKTYQYVWVKGEKLWYRTRSMRDYTFDNMVDELVRLTVDAVVCEIEVLDGPDL